MSVYRKQNGQSKLPNYSRHDNMLRRCFDEGSSSYQKYGGRGITVCDRWCGLDGLKNFNEDMGLPPSSKHTLDRIDNDGNYEPSNCRWATLSQQATNTRMNPRNTTGYRGVTYFKRIGRYMVQLRHEGFKYNLGCYDTAEEAAIVYDQAAIQFRGHDAKTNIL